MEGYRVICSKKILLCDIHDQHEQKVENSQQLEIEEIPSNSVSFEMIPSSPLPDEFGAWCLETESASENDPPAFGRRHGRIVQQSSFEQYASYICPQCNKYCGPMEKWKLHTETEHGFGLLETANVESIVNKNGELCHKCRDCPKMFQLTRGFSAMIAHRITHLPYRNYVACRICTKRYKSNWILKIHLQREHKYLKVNSLPRFSDSALEHIRLFCPICKEEQSNVSDWRAHMKEQHDYYNKARSKYEFEGNNIYTCTICKWKVRENNLVEHIQLHENFKAFVCTYCNESNTQLQAALRHVRIKHLRTPKELLCICSLCKATFESQSERRKHYYDQHKVVFQTCKVCKKKFDSSSTLFAHMNLTNHHTLKSGS